MFVRTIWKLRRLVDIPQHIREMSPAKSHAQEFTDFGISPREFLDMTRSEFDINPDRL